MHACSDFVEPFLWNVDKRCMKLFCFEGNLIRALLNSLNGHAHTKTAIVHEHLLWFCWAFLWNVDKKCMKLFCFEGNLIRALLNSLNGCAHTKTAIACTCMHQFAWNFFAGYSNVSLHFVFTKLFHQITPYMIITQV